jgi:hypothetical protein
MDIQIKSFKESQFASEETLCYQAVIYVDGVRAIAASNEGHGGCDNYQRLDITPAAKAAFDEAMAKIEAHVKTLDPIDMSKHGIEEPMDWDAELFINTAVSDFSTMKYLKRQMIRRVVCVEEGKPAFELSWKGLKKLTEAHIAKAEKQNPTAIVLNRLPIQEAFDLYKEFA